MFSVKKQVFSFLYSSWRSTWVKYEYITPCVLTRRLLPFFSCLFLPSGFVSASICLYLLSLFASQLPWNDGNAEQTDIPQGSSCFTDRWQQRQLKMWASAWLTSQQAAKNKMHLYIFNWHSKNRRIQQGSPCRGASFCSCWNLIKAFMDELQQKHEQKV